MMFRDKEIFITDPEQFVGIIKGEIFHSNSPFDMERFFEQNSKYDEVLAEIALDGVSPITLLTCSDDEQILKIWKTAQKNNYPFLMQYYKEKLLKEADYIIKADFEEEEDEPADEDWEND